ncbi:MAG: cell division protein FtsL [Elusimicrobia bacterium]|nr:cell division protein FtsL [Elusimicrobiota bacterium]
MKKKTVVTLILFGSFTLFLLVWQHLQAVWVGYELQSLLEAMERQRNLNAYLQLELQRLHSPLRIEQVARGKLGLVSVTQGTVIELDPLPLTYAYKN